MGFFYSVVMHKKRDRGEAGKPAIRNSPLQIQTGNIGKMNEIYFSNDLETFHFVQFLNANEVISVSISNNNSESPSDVWDAIRHWFNENYRDSRGRFSDFGEAVCWYVESEQGVIMYYGKKIGNELHVQTHSHINNHMSGLQRFRKL